MIGSPGKVETQGFVFLQGLCAESSQLHTVVHKALALSGSSCATLPGAQTS